MLILRLQDLLETLALLEQLVQILRLQDLLEILALLEKLEQLVLIL